MTTQLATLGVGVAHKRLVGSAEDPNLRTVAEAPSDSQDSDGDKKPQSPLTLAILRSRWLDVFSTPCHGHGETFMMGEHFGT